MDKSHLEQLPEIVANGRKQAERILESLESRQRVRLQTREVVLPAKDSAAQDWVTGQQRAERQVTAEGDGWMNRLIYGDNHAGHGRAVGGRPAHTQPGRQGGLDLHRPAV